jgi:hypothetical protein
MKLSEEEQKERDDIEDRFILLTTLSLVQDYLKDKREKEALQQQQQQTGQAAQQNAAAENKKALSK